MRVSTPFRFHNSVVFILLIIALRGSEIVRLLNYRLLCFPIFLLLNFFLGVMFLIPVRPNSFVLRIRADEERVRRST